MRARRVVGVCWATIGGSGGRRGAPVEQDRAKSRLAAIAERPATASGDPAGAGQGLEAGPSAVGREPGDDRRGQVERDGGAAEAGHGVPGGRQRPELVGQRRARLDRPLDGQPVGRVELVVEVGGQERFVVEVHVVRRG